MRKAKLCAICSIHILKLNPQKDSLAICKNPQFRAAVSDSNKRCNYEQLETDLNNMSGLRKPPSEKKSHFKCSFLVTVNTFF